MNWLTILLQSIIAVQTVFPTLKGQSKSNIVLGLVNLGAGITANAITQAHVNQAVSTLQAAGVMAKDQVPTV